MGPSFLTNVERLTRSPRSRAFASATVRRARDPKTMRQIEQVRARLAERTAGRVPATR